MHRDLFSYSFRIIGERLFAELADDGDTLYVLNADRLDMRNICDWRAICLLAGATRGLGEGEKKKRKEVGLNGYIAGFLCEPGCIFSICMRRVRERGGRTRDGGGGVRAKGGAIENFPDCVAKPMTERRRRRKKGTSGRRGNGRRRRRRRS